MKPDLPAAGTDSPRAEMRLMWGGLGAVVVVPGLIFTLPFAR